VAVHYNIRDSGDALRVDVRREIAFWERMLASLLAAFVIWQLPDRFLPAYARTGSAIIVAAVVFVLFRSLSARLLVTKLELRSEGAGKRGLGAGTRGTRTVLMAKIYRLEYQEHESGGQGIYAVTAFGEPQVLPYVDGAQADEIIAAIKTKFPALAEMWKRSEDAAARGRG
jgi:hypothetical protein